MDDTFRVRFAKVNQQGTGSQEKERMNIYHNVADEESDEVIDFYRKSLQLLNESGADYLLGGGFAFYHYTGIKRDTKDLDLFCKSSEYPKLLSCLEENGYRTEVPDSRWISKVFDKEDRYIDLIFDTPNGVCPVDDSWFQRATKCSFAGVNIKALSAEELIWCKIYVQNRERFDGADINHLLLSQGNRLDWNHLLNRLDRHWHLLFSQLLNFQFVYPSEHQQIIPKWLFDELIRRAEEQYSMPAPAERVCRGPLLDQTQYGVDIKEWDYKVITMKTV